MVRTWSYEPQRKICSDPRSTVKTIWGGNFGVKASRMWSRRRGSVARNGHGLSASSPLWWNRGGTGPSCPGLRTIQTWTQGRTPLFPNPQSKNGLQSLAPSHWQVISLGSASPHKVSLFKCNSSPYRILSSAHPLSIHAGRAGLPSPTPQWTKTQATLTLALSSVWGVTLGSMGSVVKSACANGQRISELKGSRASFG